MNLSKNVKITVISAAAAAGTTEVDSSIIDMAGFDGVVFVAVTGALTINSVITLTAQENTANSTSGMAAITGGATPAYTALGTETLNTFIVDIFRPIQRYLRVALTRTAANTVVNSIIAIQYHGTKLPPALDATVLASAFIAPTA